jgi:hypothetical protein
MLLRCDCTKFEADLIESQSRQGGDVLRVRWNSSVPSGGENASSVRSVARNRQVLLASAKSGTSCVFKRARQGSCHSPATFGEGVLAEERERQLHSEKRACPRSASLVAVGSEGQAEALPSEAAMASGTPNSLIVTCSDGEARTLRANRSCHERRVCARCARERGEGETTEGAEDDPSDSICTSTRWWRRR